MRLLKKGLFIVVVGASVLLLAGALVMRPTSKAALLDGSEDAFGARATVNGVLAWPGTYLATVGFSDYALPGPEGFEEPILSIEEIRASLATTSLLSETKEASMISLDGVTLTFEQVGARSNVAGLLDGLERTSGEEGVGPDLRVLSSAVINARARFKLSGVPGLEPLDQTIDVSLASLQLDERARTEGLTVADLSRAVMASLAASALEEAQGTVRDDALALMEASLSGQLDDDLAAAVDAAKASAMDKAARRNAEARAAMDDANAKLEGAITETLRSVGDGLTGDGR